MLPLVVDYRCKQKRHKKVEGGNIMNNYANEHGLDSNNYFLNEYLSEYERKMEAYDFAPTHEYYVEADIVYTESDDYDGEDIFVHLDGYVSLKEGFEEQDFDDLSWEDQLKAVGFTKETYPNCYDIVDAQFKIEC